MKAPGAAFASTGEQAVRPGGRNGCPGCEEETAPATDHPADDRLDSSLRCENAECGHLIDDHDNEDEIIGGQCFECPCAVFVFPDNGDGAS